MFGRQFKRHLRRPQIAMELRLPVCAPSERALR